MGTYSIIDDDPNKAPRCLHVKLAVVLINLIGSSVTLLFLIYCINKMIKKKRQIKILTTIILLIFFSEVVQCVSKLLQILKYAFEDRRLENEYKMNGRAIICQFQIVLAIYADYCSLVSTFLLSLKCYDSLKYKNKYFSNDNQTKIKIIIYTVLGCLLAGLLFLLFDRIISEGNFNYKYDSRDRCSYWCWLGHFSSLVCFGFYWFILIANIILSYKTLKFLNEKQQELLEGSEYMITSDDKTMENEDNIEDKSNEIENNENSKDSNQVAKALSFSHNMKKHKINNEDSERINDLILIKIKCTIYPIATIFIWLLFAIYRLFDDFMMEPFDRSDSEDDNNDDEIEYFEDHPNLAILVQTFLVIHTILSSTRGLVYGMSFIIFEEKMFGSFFRKWFGVKNEVTDGSSQTFTEKKIEDDYLRGNKEYNGGENYNDEDNYKEDGALGRISENVEMNTSEVRFIEEKD